jgi:adenosylhomocysteine nucleosidase
MDLEPGALVIPSRIVGAEGEVFAVASDWRARLAARLGAAVPVTDGALAESLSVVVDVAAKQAIRQATGAVATDMESAALARVAQRQGVPFIAIRSIADSAAMRLPEPVCRALKPRGDVYLGKMLGYAFRDPAQFLELARLGRAFGRAMATLRKVAAIAGPDIGFPQSRADAVDFVSSFS